MQVKMRRTPEGKLVPILPSQDTKATTEAKPDPRDAPDPRPASFQNVPPYAAGG
jgi:hypothetical protein